MSSTITALLTLTLTLTLSLLPPSTAAQLTVYDALQAYDFPVGLLPKGVTSYELDPATGKFSVKLNGTCTFSIDSYDLKYKSTISGTISRDRITNLKGIQVKVLLFWVNIVEVTKDNDELEFSVGIASASFPLDSFYESPQCGCGFDCVDSGDRKLERGVTVLDGAVSVLGFD